MSVIVNTRHLIIFGIGWFLSAGIVWSADVYGLSVGLSVFLIAIPWVLVAGTMAVALRSPPAVQLDLTKMAVQGGLRTQHFATGQCIIQQGDVADHFYIITSGRARVLMDDEYGSRTEVAELVEGQFFGEVGLLTGRPRMATVEALDELDVLVMDKMSFANIVGHAGAASEFIRSVAEQRVAEAKK